ncbi:MAG: Hsp20/alpha crystallin family protein [Bacteroidia bacterium]|nr:Hsp20/alpha crystallin family protein [Bacteroidia bacterium]
MNNEYKPEDFFQSFKEGFSELQKKVGGFMDDVFSGEGSGSELRVRSDVYLTRDQYVIELEIPGVKKEDVSIQIHDGILNVKGTKFPVENAENFVYIKQERQYGSFLKSFTLPVSVVMEEVKAKYETGLLIIRFPRNVEGDTEDSSKINIE